MITQAELWQWMMDGKYPPGYPDIDRKWLMPVQRQAFATLKESITLHRPGTFKDRIRKGTKVRVVMASRMGDVGVTRNLDAHAGYTHRIQCVEGTLELNNETFAVYPEDILDNIELIEDPEAPKMGLQSFEEKFRADS